MNRLLLPLALIAVLLLPSTALAQSPSVFLLVVDEMAASTIMNQRDQIDDKRFPHLANLANQATWYRNHTTVADFTYASIPSILYGQRPADGNNHNNYDYRQGHSIYRMLGPSYKRTVWQQVNPVCPSCPTPPASNHLAGAKLRPGVGYQGHSRYVAGAIKSIKKGRRANLWIVHMLMPHVPWQFLPNGSQYREDEIGVPGMVLFSWDNQEYPIALNQQRMMLQSQFVDRVIGSFTRSIKRAGLWNNSIVIVTADHGGDFVANSHRRSVLEARFSEAANVPLLVKYPDQNKGLISDRATNHSQILATINAATINKRRYRGTTLDQSDYNISPRVRNSINDTTVTTTMAAMIESRNQAIRLRDQRLSTISSFLLNDEINIVGQQIGSTRLPLAARPGQAVIELDHPEYYRNFKPKANYIPGALLSADIKGLPLGAKVIVSSRGRAVASGEVFNYWPQPQDIFKGPNYRKKLMVMLNPELLPRGNAQLNFYQQSPTGLEEIEQD